MLEFRTNDPISPDEFRDVLIRSTLAERRPIHDVSCLAGMVRQAGLLVTAWDGGLLVGVARSVTDFQYCCYLSDLAVDVAYQRRGIGKELIRRTRAALGPRCTLILLAAPKAVDYYAPLGFERHPQAWTLSPSPEISQ